jgi:fatty-acyl-CoA synthase
MLMTTFDGPPVDTEMRVGALTFGGFLEELAERFGDREAIVWAPSGGSRVSWTYRQLLQEARVVAKALIAVGVTRGTRVGVLMGSRPEWVSCVWGAAMAGGVAVPFNTFAERDELGHVLRHSDVAVVLCERRLLHHDYVAALLDLCPDALSAAPGQLYSVEYPFLRRIVALDNDSGGGVQTWGSFIDGSQGIADELLDEVLKETVPSEEGVIIYSSGTTALPKGVLHRHRAAMMQSWRHGYREQWAPDDRVYGVLPLFWTAGFAAVLGGTLATGACMVLSSHFDPSHALDVIEQERITGVQCLPVHAAAMVECQTREPRDLSSIRRYSYRFTGKTPPAGARPLANYASYGSSETFTSATALPFDAPLEELDTFGRVVPGMSIRILDPVSQTSLGVREEGEIVIRGSAMMCGYVKLPPEAAFDEDGFFHSGDSGWFDEAGLLHFTGRLSHIIKTSGANVSPLEVEERLMSHPEFDEAAVVGIPDPILGEIVVACVVTAAGSSATEETVQQFLRGSLASYKIPRRVLFFAEGELPRTASQKHNVAEIRSLAMEKIGAEQASLPSR